MEHIEFKEISAELIQKLEEEALYLSKSGIRTGWAALGGAAIASLFPVAGTIAAAVIGAGAVGTAYQLSKKLKVDEKLTGAKTIIRQAQDQLKAEGLYENAVDGVLGEFTQIAIGKFQSINGLVETGVIDKDTLTSLNCNATADFS